MGVNVTKKQKISSIIVGLITITGTSCLFFSFLFDNLYLGFYGLLIYYIILTLGWLALSNRVEELQMEIKETCKGGCNGCFTAK